MLPLFEKARSALLAGREKSHEREETNRFTEAIDMLQACEHVDSMHKMIQVRNVPSSLHRTLKARAATAGMTLSDYLLTELRRVAERPTLEEMQARLGSRTPVTPTESAADAVRAERDAR